MEQLIIPTPSVATTNRRPHRRASCEHPRARASRELRVGFMTGRTSARRPPSRSAVGVPERAFRRDPVADALLELLELGEPALGGARPDGLTVQGDLEDSLVAGAQGDFGELPLEG